MYGLRQIAGAAFLLLASHVQAIAAQVPGIVSAPSATMATIVFMRPSEVGIFNHAPIFDISNNGYVPLGRLGARAKLAFAVTPGNHRFMVIGKGTGFLDADLVGGKVYYVLITPDPGSSRPHFLFSPITASTTPGLFGSYQALTEWTAVDPDAVAWGDGHKGSIQKMEAEGLQSWKGTPRLDAGDAR